MYGNEKILHKKVMIIVQGPAEWKLLEAVKQCTSCWKWHISFLKVTLINNYKKVWNVISLKSVLKMAYFLYVDSFIIVLKL